MATIAFDIVGTLFSLEAPRRALIDCGASPSTLELWFAQALRDYFSLSHSGHYVPLKQVLEAALPRALLAEGIEPDAAVIEQVMASLDRLEPAEHALEGCEMLDEAGFELMAVTNSSRQMTVTILERSGLDDYIDSVVSCDSLGTSKPHPKVYRRIQEHGQSPRWMVAAHGWDISGAAHAGLNTAWISKVENLYLDVFPPPDVVADTIQEAAHQIIG